MGEQRETIKPKTFILLAFLLALGTAPASASAETSLLATLHQKVKNCASYLAGHATRMVELPKRLMTMKRLIDEQFQTATLDRNLYAFYGYHTQPGVNGYLMRPWDKANIKSITPDSIQGMSTREFLAVLQVGMEIEVPILDYSRESGKAFHILLPSLGRFMGRNPHEEAKALEEAKAQGKELRCDRTTPWCREEDRHGDMWKRLIEKLSGKPANMSNPDIATITSAEEKGAVMHLGDREGTEWGASAAYFILATHSTQDLQIAVKNVLADEIKHLSIVSGADKYLFGTTPMARIKRMLHKTAYEVRTNSGVRTDSDKAGNLYNAIEIVAAHVMIEIKMRRWLRQVPFRTLRGFFEPNSQRGVLPATPMTVMEQSEFAQKLAKSAEMRETLARWPEGQRKFVMAQQKFEEQNAELIDLIIASKLDGFKGIEASDEHVKEVLNKIDNMDVARLLPPGSDSSDIPLLISALRDRAVDYRIKKNGPIE